MSGLDRLTESLEGATGLDAPADKVAGLVGRVLSPPRLRDLASGRGLGHPLHPAAVLAPAGALLAASALDAFRDKDMAPAARRLVGLGLLSAAPAALAGWSDWLDTEGAERRVGLVHAASNLLGLAAYAVSWGRRRSGKSGAVAGSVGLVALGAGGWLGGHLAYAQGVGVDTTAFQSGPMTWTDVAASNDITIALTRVEPDGVGILLTRVAGRCVAIADRCTHRGAPLSQGKRDADCVICPWHASAFDLNDGSVRRGPATRPQPDYDVRELDGRVQVRRLEERALRTNSS